MFLSPVPKPSHNNKFKFSYVCVQEKVQLPAIPEMKSSIREREKALEKIFYGTEPVKLFVDPVPYLNEIAELLDCKPNCGTNPRLQSHSLAVSIGARVPLMFKLCRLQYVFPSGFSCVDRSTCSPQVLAVSIGARVLLRF